MITIFLHMLTICHLIVFAYAMGTRFVLETFKC